MKKTKDTGANLFKGKVIHNTGVKYSQLLEQFMSAFTNDFKHLEYQEDIFELAIAAWNFGNMEIIAPEFKFEQLPRLEADQDIDFVLMRKLIDYKISKFKAYNNFIVDYEFKDMGPGKNHILSVVTQEKDAYLGNIMESPENERTPDDFQENFINRSAIILKPQQPFIDWCLQLNTDSVLMFEEDFKKTNVYLIDENIGDIEKWLKKKFDAFFMMELEQWSVDEKQWPQKRNFKMFNQWFAFEISEMVYDIENKPVLKSF